MWQVRRDIRRLSCRTAPAEAGGLTVTSPFHNTNCRLAAAARTTRIYGGLTMALPPHILLAAFGTETRAFQLTPISTSPRRSSAG